MGDSSSLTNSHISFLFIVYANIGNVWLSYFLGKLSKQNGVIDLRDYTLTLIFVWPWPLYDIDMVLSFVMTLTLLHKHEKIAKFICKKLERRALRMSFLVTFILFI